MKITVTKTYTIDKNDINTMIKEYGEFHDKIDEDEFVDVLINYMEDCCDEDVHCKGYEKIMSILTKYMEIQKEINEL